MSEFIKVGFIYCKTFIPSFFSYVSFYSQLLAKKSHGIWSIKLNCAKLMTLHYSIAS